MTLATFDDVTESLKNGAALPSHPALTTARRITAYGPVSDAANGTPLTGGLHRNEITMLMGGQQVSLAHLYRFAIVNEHIYHTRPLVVIDVATEEVLEHMLESTP